MYIVLCKWHFATERHISALTVLPVSMSTEEVKIPHEHNGHSDCAVSLFVSPNTFHKFCIFFTSTSVACAHGHEVHRVRCLMGSACQWAVPECMTIALKHGRQPSTMHNYVTTHTLLIVVRRITPIRQSESSHTYGEKESDREMRRVSCLV